MTFSLEDSIQHLARTPFVLDAWLRDLPDDWVRSNEGTGTWSPFDIVGHLIHGERTDWMPRTRKILTGGAEAEFEPFDRFAQEESSRGKSMGELLDEFAHCRGESLRELRDLELGPRELERCGVHPEFGSVRLDHMLAAWTAHDLAHIAQTARAMACRFQSSVGPWKKYLAIVGPRRE
jgi:hypothetical protein